MSFGRMILYFQHIKWIENDDYKNMRDKCRTELGDKNHMHIRDKIFMDCEQLEANGPITIVAFGDSVTHGALRGKNNYETVYWNLLKKKLNNFRDYVPVNVINAGIGGITAKRSLGRLDKQVLAHDPDLVIVCFGLNDVNGTLEEYLEALDTIFDKCKDSGADVIFMTPNMLNTYVADDTESKYLEYAAVTADFQNNGKMDLFMDSAVKLAKEKNIMVCDCYSKWKELSKTEDTTKLLVNRINHPEQKMHTLFADELYKILMEGTQKSATPSSSTMYQK